MLNLYIYRWISISYLVIKFYYSLTEIFPESFPDTMSDLTLYYLSQMEYIMKIMGKANKKESTLSRSPPCPGIQFPESFTP